MAERLLEDARRSETPVFVDQAAKLAGGEDADWVSEREPAPYAAKPRKSDSSNQKPGLCESFSGFLVVQPSKCV